MEQQKKEETKPTTSSNIIAQTTTQAPTKVKTVLELLEEDDEFEEFEGESWDQINKKQQQQDGKLWKDDWEDDEVNDNFTNQLRSIIESRSQGGGNAAN